MVQLSLIRAAEACVVGRARSRSCRGRGRSRGRGTDRIGDGVGVGHGSGCGIRSRDSVRGSCCTSRGDGGSRGARRSVWNTNAAPAGISCEFLQLQRETHEVFSLRTSSPSRPLEPLVSQ